MNIYPALKARLGNWTYYMVKMTARELGETVKFAYEVYDDRTLDEAIQRVLNESRVKKQIVDYLKRQEDRFFSSIVIAALDGDPKFYSVQITDDPQFPILSDDKRFNETYGVLRFDGTQTYYALDGQHRLKAIKTLLNPDDPLSDGAPKDFHLYEFSVLIVVPSSDETSEQFLQKYWRLFSNLNRYAKAMDQATNIIMDEDDTFAIVTRRLITDHDFFMSAGKQRESVRIKTSRGKNLKTGETFFTSIETLYEMNKNLLRSRWRDNNGWGLDGGEKEQDFIKIRPDEEYLSSLYEELVIYWNAILDEIPDLHKEPSKMRTHSLSNEDSDEDSTETDHLLFWPIGQEMLTNIVREALDRRLPDIQSFTPQQVRRALLGLGQVQWLLHGVPWKNFLLVEKPDKPGEWTMRSEERKAAVRVGQRLVQWLVGIDELDEQALQVLQDGWTKRLIPAQTSKIQDEWWNRIVHQQEEIANSLGVQSIPDD
ncbi:MAG: DGQHR domain-containing protein [Blastocatellia bacterium]|nr:DGQHR domain-containing protein [Blastocatellia bacterium]